MIHLFGIIKQTVANSFDDDPAPPGGVTLTMSYDPDTGHYQVNVDAGETGCSSEAPSLELAVRALEYLDEGEHALVSPGGHPLCADCRGDGCGECGKAGGDPSPPHGWPKGGLPPGDPNDAIWTLIEADKAIARAREEERERCAKVAEDYRDECCKKNRTLVVGSAARDWGIRANACNTVASRIRAIPTEPPKEQR